MVAYNAIKTTNTAILPRSLPHGLTAVFLGATSGIGQSALRQLAQASIDKAPRIYIVGRNARAAEPFLAELRQTNPSGTFIFVENDVSLIKGVNAAVVDIKDSIQKESESKKIDLLFMSMGFISFDGRKETSEGLDASMSTRYYSRLRAIQLLLPLLNAAASPHVVNILAGGQESHLLVNDLDLVEPKNYSIARAAGHSATMLTLSLERLASQNPAVSFVHAFPGLVATGTLTKGSSGVVNFLFRWLVVPVLNTFFATSVEEAGGRALFYATNARYTNAQLEELAVPIPTGLERAGQTAKGVFLVNEKSESVGDEKLLAELRETVAEKVWAHTMSVFEKAASG